MRYTGIDALEAAFAAMPIAGVGPQRADSLNGKIEAAEDRAHIVDNFRRNVLAPRSVQSDMPAG
jgi:hypothetical protein